MKVLVRGSLGVAALLLVSPAQMASAEGPQEVDAVFSVEGITDATTGTRQLGAVGKTLYFDVDNYQYTAVRFSQGGAKVRLVRQGDGPGNCFVGRLVRPQVYRGSDYTFGVGSRRATYRRSQVLGGERVTPPRWFQKSSKVAFNRPECS